MEEFFYISIQIDEIRLKDLLLRRYHQIDFIKDMELGDLLELINLVLEEEKREEKRQEWLHLLPLMITSGKYTAFNDYYDMATGKNIDMRPADVIMAEIDAKHEKVKKDGT